MVRKRACLGSLHFTGAVKERSDMLHAHAAAARALQVRGGKTEAAAVRLRLYRQQAALRLCMDGK